jgi:hypothetical protein
MASIELRVDPQRSLAAGSITGSYTAIGTAFERPMRIVKIQNLADATLQFSFDGVTDHITLPENGFLLIDVTANQADARGFFVSVGTTIYAKQLGVPTTGAVYVTAMYARGS